MLSPGFAAVVADDDPITRGIVSQHLHKLGAAEVFQAEDGAQALGFLQNHSDVSLLVSDLRMPNMDGVRLLREIADSKLQLSIVLISGLGDKLLLAAQQVAEGRQLHILGTVGKPVELGALRALLKQSPSTSSRAIPVDGDEAEPDPLLLKRSIENKQLRIFVQPEVPLDDSLRMGVEVLVRWTTPELLGFGTETLIRATERLNLIDALTEQVLQLANQAWQDWTAVGVSPRVSFNISAQLFENVELPERLIQLLTSIPPEDVVIEMTETALSKAVTLNLDVATRLRLLGFGLALDDFGTGYSTLSELKMIPFEELKIDQSFTAKADVQAEDRTIVESTIAMARSLGLRTVAEGVETAAQLALMCALKADYVQGYYFSKPMPAEQFPAWFKAFKMPPLPPPIS